MSVLQLDTNAYTTTAVFNAFLQTSELPEDSCDPKEHFLCNSPLLFALALPSHARALAKSSMHLTMVKMESQEVNLENTYPTPASETSLEYFFRSDSLEVPSILPTLAAAASGDELQIFDQDIYLSMAGISVDINDEGYMNSYFDQPGGTMAPRDTRLIGCSSASPESGQQNPLGGFFHNKQGKNSGEDAVKDPDYTMSACPPIQAPKSRPIPKKNSRRREPGHVKRPPNSFMIYRKEKHYEVHDMLDREGRSCGVRFLYLF